MINFRQKEDFGPSVLILASILVLAATLIYMVFVPAPTTNGLAQGKEIERQQLVNQIANAKSSIAHTRTLIKPRVWYADPNTVNASVLALVTSKAIAQSETVSAFRPQRQQELVGITELPYTVQITGSFAGVREIMKSLDKDGSKVILRSVEIAASEQSDYSVSATLGLSAYIATDPDLLPATSKGAHNEN